MTFEEIEKGRIKGIKQVAAFVRKVYDNPIIADDIIKWVIPHGYKTRSAIYKANRKSRLA